MLIDSEEVKEWLNSIGVYGYDWQVDELPSAERVGHWITVNCRTIPYNRISKSKKCSECGKAKDKYVVWNYCPNCGARMGGVKEE